MRKIKEFWGKLKYWQKGAIIGVIFGLAQPFIMFFEGLYVLFGWEYFLFCNVLKLEPGEPCGWAILSEGFIIFPIVYGLFGVLTGFVIDKIKGK